MWCTYRLRCVLKAEWKASNVQVKSNASFNSSGVIMTSQKKFGFKRARAAPAQDYWNTFTLGHKVKNFIGHLSR